MSIYKDLLCEVEDLREQLVEMVTAVDGLRELATENSDWISVREVLLQLSGVRPQTPKFLQLKDTP